MNVLATKKEELRKCDTACQASLNTYFWQPLPHDSHGNALLEILKTNQENYRKKVNKELKTETK